MKCFLFAASDAEPSLNKQLAHRMRALLENQGHQVDCASFDDVVLPLYSAKYEAKEGVPHAAEAFVKRLQTADKTILISPEYNWSIPGTLKNLIDWVSRIKPMPWNGSELMLASASPSIYGGMRGLIALRIPLAGCGAFVFPKTYSLSNASAAFAEDGTFKDAKNEENLKKTLEAFLCSEKR